MITTDLAIQQGTTRLALRTERATRLTIDTGAHGLESIKATLPLTLYQAFDLYTRLSANVRAVVSVGSIVASGRCEDIAITNEGADIEALGDWRALSDVPYTALLSDTQIERWRPLGDGEATSSLPYRFTFDLDDDIVIAANNNSSQSSTVIGFVGYEPPDDTTRNPLAIQCDITLAAPAANWQTAIQSRDANWGSGTNHFLLSTAGAGTLTRSVCLLFAAQARLDTFLRFNAAAAAFAGQTGDAYVRLRNIRVVSALWVNTSSAALVTAGAGKVITPGSMDNIAVGSRLRIDDTAATTEIVTVTAITATTFTATFANGYAANFRIQASHVETSLTANATAGSSVTLTVGSTARMYVGQRLVIASGGSTSESVVVSSITSSTQVVVATLATNQVSGATVQALGLYADQVAKVLRAGVTAVNAAPLSTSNALIQSPGLDLLDVVYEDAAIGEALDDLAAAGDGTQLWEVGVDTLARLYFRPQGSDAQMWYVDASAIEAQQTLTQLVNSAYAIYKSASGRITRTTPAGDADSVTRYGLTRRKAVKANTTNATIAAQMAANAVLAAATPIPQSSVSFDRVFTAQGADAPLHQVRAGDTFVIRNLPASADTAIDKLRSFRLARTSYDVLARVLDVVPESPLPELEYQLAEALPPL